MPLALGGKGEESDCDKEGTVSLQLTFVGTVNRDDLKQTNKQNKNESESEK